MVGPKLYRHENEKKTMHLENSEKVIQMQILEIIK